MYVLHHIGGCLLNHHCLICPPLSSLSALYCPQLKSLILQDLTLLPRPALKGCGYAGVRCLGHAIRGWSLEDGHWNYTSSVSIADSSWLLLVIPAIERCEQANCCAAGDE